MGFSCSPCLCLSCCLLSSAFFSSLWNLPIALLQTSNILLSPCSQIGLCDQDHVSALPLDAPSQTQAGLEGWFPPFCCGRGEMWGKLRAPGDPQQCYPGLAGARSRENLPWHLFPMCLVSPSSFQGLKARLGELQVGTQLLLGRDQWLGGKRYH